jgi:predicted flap endonuclease-1-like 5' DNA nuclease
MYLARPQAEIVLSIALDRKMASPRFKEVAHPLPLESCAKDDGGGAMADPPDLRPVGDLPNEIGKTAARELSLHGITSLQQVAAHSRRELLAFHGVGPKAIAVLGDALTAKGLAYRSPE